MAKFVNEQAGVAEPEEKPAVPSGKVTAKQMIAFMDKNSDGKISKDEASDDLKNSFQYVDTNGDGVIDVKEAQIMADYVNNQQK